ncbi:MAG: hypothetical protein ABIJ96_06835 [Elusimicrobiota bacterium]
MSEEIKVQLKGPQAIMAVLVLIGIGGFQWVRLGVNFPTGGPAEEVKHWVVNTYHGGELEEALDEAAENLTEDAGKKVLAAAAKQQALSKVEITGLSVRRSGKNEYVVRVDFLLDGRPPPDGKGQRYLRVENRSPGGWFVRHETSAFSYYSTFF